MNHMRRFVKYVYTLKPKVIFSNRMLLFGR